MSAAASTPREPLPAASWTEDAWGTLRVRGRTCTIYMQRRPQYCDRGNFLAYLEADSGSELARELDEADGWPRYYFDETRAKLEIEAWLQKRGQWPEPRR